MTNAHCIVVGFGPGVGFGIAQAFAGAGFNLSLITRNLEKVQPQLADLKRFGVSVEAFAADAGNADALEKAIHEARTRLGPPAVLHYNVAALSAGKPSALEPAALTRDLNSNVVGALACARAVLPTMLERNFGRLLFTGGGWALYPSAAFASLSIGKAALRALAFTLAEELKDTGIRAGILTIMGAVQPGTPFDPQNIGSAFLNLFNQPNASFQTETQFKGSQS